MGRQAVGLVAQAIESAFQFVSITGERLQRFDVHAESHHAEDRRMFSELPREFAHRVGDSIDFFGSHAA